MRLAPTKSLDGAQIQKYRNDKNWAIEYKSFYSETRFLKGPEYLTG